MSEAETKNRMINSADLLRRGASLLREPCPKCGGLQMRYLGTVYCLNEDNLDAVLSNKPASSPTTSTKKESKLEPLRAPSESSNSLRKMLEGKLATVSKQLDETNDVQEQARLLDLISKYIETLDKLKKSDS
ncbi:MAG: Sjogren's syndrome/scleroderma autoantigen 1 family protein [Rhabdochlamydiaceae bacterium]